MFLAAQSGAQAAIMAPTEILAEQHFKNLSKLFATVNAQGIPHPLNVRLLTGSTPASDRETILAEIADGHANIVVGTHALIQETVTFNDLALAIDRRAASLWRGATRRAAAKGLAIRTCW